MTSGPCHVAVGLRFGMVGKIVGIEGPPVLKTLFVGFPVIEETPTSAFFSDDKEPKIGMM